MSSLSKFSLSKSSLLRSGKTSPAASASHRALLSSGPVRLAVAATAVACCAGLVSAPSATAAQATASSAVAGQATATAAAATGKTRFGVTIQPRGHENYPAAYARATRTYGKLGVTRVFHSGLPKSFANLQRTIGNSPAAISFKASPSAILSGRYDSQLRGWFASLPKDRPTWWSYMPEPEDDIMWHKYSAAQFRAAWVHVAKLDTNSAARATLTLMCYTLKKSSHRNWRDYYPGSQYVDTFAWDCYNKGIQDNFYGNPADMWGAQRDLARSQGKGWALGEFGSKLIRGDSNGSGRAAWLTSTASFLRSNGAEFAAYFDSTQGGEFRLLDARSQQAWRSAVSSSW